MRPKLLNSSPEEQFFWTTTQDNTISTYVLRKEFVSFCMRADFNGFYKLIKILAIMAYTVKQTYSCRGKVSKFFISVFTLFSPLQITDS